MFLGHFAVGLAAKRAAPSVSLGVLLVAYCGAAFGPPPPNVSTIAVSGLALWILVLWGWRADRRP